MLGLLALSLLGQVASAQTRVATVDLRKVFDNYWKTKQADLVLKERGAEIEKEGQNLVTDYNKLNDDYKSLMAAANDGARSQEERDKQKKAAEDKLKQIKDSADTIKQYQAQGRTTIEEQKNRMRDNIVEEIRTALNAKAKSAGYALVIDSSAVSATGTPIVMFSNNENDLTQALLEQLNIGAPSEPAKSEDKKEPKAEEKKKDEKKKGDKK
jgi:Skp family chaperone for outer membrane proteins